MQKKRRAIFDKHRFHADILILQETHSTPEIETIWEKEWGGKIVFAHGTGSKKGVAILFSKKFSPKISNICKDIEGRYITLDIQEGDQNVSITAIYAPKSRLPRLLQ